MLLSNLTTLCFAVHTKHDSHTYHESHDYMQEAFLAPRCF